jgi:hypothetical protein
VRTAFEYIAIWLPLFLALSPAVYGQDFSSHDKYIPPANSPFDLTGVSDKGYQRPGSFEDFGNVFKINILNSVRGIFAIEYERKVFDFMSIESSLGFTAFPDYIKRSYQDEEVFRDVISPAFGLHVHGGPRFYIGDVFDDSWMSFNVRYTTYQLEFARAKGQHTEKYIDYCVTYGISILAGKNFNHDIAASFGFRKYDAVNLEAADIYDPATGTTRTEYFPSRYSYWGGLFLVHYRIGIAF